MNDLFAIVAGSAIAVVFLLFIWESNKMIDEKKERQRLGTHDYYDNKIEKDE
jgi:hypothetical protein